MLVGAACVHFLSTLFTIAHYGTYSKDGVGVPDLKARSHFPSLPVTKKMPHSVRDVCETRREVSTNGGIRPHNVMSRRRWRTP